MLRLCPMLVVEVNRVVSVDRLVDQLWGDDPPRRAVGSQHAYVSNLRRILEYDRPPRALLEAAASAAQAMGTRPVRITGPCRSPRVGTPRVGRAHQRRLKSRTNRRTRTSPIGRRDAAFVLRLSPRLAAAESCGIGETARACEERSWS